MYNCIVICIDKGWIKMFLSKKKLFGNNIPPKCEYCRCSEKNNSGNPVCRFGYGIAADTCIRYVYDPLKREPQSMPTLPKFTADDFKL